MGDQPCDRAQPPAIDAHGSDAYARGAGRSARSGATWGGALPRAQLQTNMTWNCNELLLDMIHEHAAFSPTQRNVQCWFHDSNNSWKGRGGEGKQISNTNNLDIPKG